MATAVGDCAGQELRDVCFADAVVFSLEQLGLLEVTLKEEQYAAIQAIYEGRDVFVCLPTGYGKSLCYQTLPFVMEHKKFAAGIMETGKSCAVLLISPLLGWP